MESCYLKGGLCQRVAPAARLLDEAAGLVATYTGKPRVCIAESTSLIARSATVPADDGTELETRAFLHYVQNHPFVRDAVEEFRTAHPARGASAVS